MNKLDILKGGTELLVSIGVSSIVGNAIKMTTDPAAGHFKKLAIGFGGFILSSMVGDLATKYTNDKIDDTAARIKNLIHPEPTMSEDVPQEMMDYLKEDAARMGIHIEGTISENLVVEKIETQETKK